MVLLLTVCLCALAGHLYAESLGSSTLSPAMALAESAGHFEDHFLFIAPLSAAAVVLLTAAAHAGQLFRISIHVSPLLPPPNS
jgi:hypothetical protein